MSRVDGHVPKALRFCRFCSLTLLSLEITGSHILVLCSFSCSCLLSRLFAHPQQQADVLTFDCPLRRGGCFERGSILLAAAAQQLWPGLPSVLADLAESHELCRSCQQL